MKNIGKNHKIVRLSSEVHGKPLDADQKVAVVMANFKNGLYPAMDAFWMLIRILSTDS